MQGTLRTVLPAEFVAATMVSWDHAADLPVAVVTGRIAVSTISASDSHEMQLVHTVFSTDCTQQLTWQKRVLLGTMKRTSVYLRNVCYACLWLKASKLICSSSSSIKAVHVHHPPHADVHHVSLEHHKPTLCMHYKSIMCICPRICDTSSSCGGFFSTGRSTGDAAEESGADGQ